MIWRDPIHKSRSVAMWLAEWLYPTGIAEAVLRKMQEGSAPNEDLLKGRLILLPQKRESVVVDVLAALANHADMADCLPGSQVLTWLRTGAWHEPSEMSFSDLIWTTDIMGICYIDYMEAVTIKDLDREIAVRALKHPKVTILFGGKRARDFRMTIEAYDGRVERYKC